MDEQKKQKVMIGVLAVAILGTGTFYWINSKPSTNKTVQNNAGPVKRRKRKEAPKASKAPAHRKREASTRKRATPLKVTRHTRKSSGTKKTTRRTRSHSNKRKAEKVQRKPLG